MKDIHHPVPAYPISWWTGESCYDGGNSGAARERRVPADPAGPRGPGAHWGILRASASLVLALGILLSPVCGHVAMAGDGFRVEIAPMIGCRVGGGFYDSHTGVVYDVEPSLAYGVIADISLDHPEAFLEIVWSRHQPQLDSSRASGSAPDEVTFDTFLFGGQWDAAPEAKVRPFLAGLVGVTVLQAGGNSTSRFAAALSGGVKLMPSKNFGARLEARALGVFAGGSTAGLCGASGCTILISGWGLLLFDVSGGLIVAF